MTPLRENARRAVDIFSGIGGFALACQWAEVETVAFAEIDKYASQVLTKRFAGVRNYGDVRAIPAIESCWLVCGGPPCQPASVSGKRRGTEDDRWLWPEALAVVERIRPAWVLFENPTGILSLNDGVEFERICLALESSGYEVQPIVIPASAIGAPHKRDRAWIICHSDRADALRGGSAGITHANTRQWATTQGFPAGNGWLDELVTRGIAQRANSYADALRVLDGIPARVDRLRCLGNSIVPEAAYRIIRGMIVAETETRESSIPIKGAAKKNKAFATPQANPSNRGIK